MKTLRQIVAITLTNLKSLPVRAGPSIVAVIGVAAVVAVFAAVLSMARGFERTMTAAGSEDTAIVLRSGASAELNSGLTNEQVRIVANSPGVRKNGGEPLVSAELYVLVDVPKKATGTDANVPLRGVQPSALEVRDNVEIVEGRLFTPGRNELVVGRAAQQVFAGLGLGETIRFGQTDWDIVGVFEAGGSVSESELWTDVRVLQAAYRRGNSFQSVRLKLEAPAALEALEAALVDDPRIDVDVMTEKTYYSRQAEQLADFIRLLGYPITILMAIGAVFGALNTMYSSVSARGKEIATLRALGFGPLPVMVSTMIEATLLAIAGGLAGAALAYLAFNGRTGSTLNGASFSQVVFDFAVTGELLVQGLITAIVIGIVGGFFPALRAARLPVAQALREL